MFVSKNGYMIPEIYSDLKSSMSNHDYERTCHWAVELTVSGQLKNLISWLIECVCNEYINTNVSFYKFIIEKIINLEAEKYNWKRTTTVKTTIAELITCIANEELSPTIFYKPSAGNFKTYVESLHFYSSKEFPELKNELSFFHGQDIYTTVSHLYEFMLEGQIKNVFKILHYIIMKPSIPECETLDIVSNVKRNRNDSIWLLWKILLIFTKRPPFDNLVTNYIENLFFIFSYDFSKKLRRERMNILFVGYLVCVKKKQIFSNNVYNNIVASAGMNINILFDEALKVESVKKSVNKTENTSTKNDKKVKTKMTPEEIEELNQKMKYFYVMTYKSPTSMKTLYKPSNTNANSMFMKVINVNERE